MRKPLPPWVYELACRLVWVAVIYITLLWLLLLGGLFLRAAG